MDKFRSSNDSRENKSKNENNKTHYIRNGILYTSIIGGLALIATRYKVSKPSQYLVRTGLGIKDMTISKTGIQWPFQTYKFINMEPTTFSFDYIGMSKDKLEIQIPGRYTVGPKFPDGDDTEELKKYVRIMENSKEYERIIYGILEGEFRTLTSSLDIESIFNDKKALNETLKVNMQSKLDDLGLLIINANIRELKELQSNYFENKRRYILAEAENKAKIDVAEENKKGDIGEKERESLTRQQVAQFEQDAVIVENKRNQEILKSNAQLKVIEADTKRIADIARIEATNQANLRQTELETELNKQQIKLKEEQLRAMELAQITINAEKQIKESEGIATSIKIKADANLYAKQQEASGQLAVYNAQAEGIQKLITSFKGDPNSLLKYMMLNEGLYEKLAKENANAIKNLQPKITNYNLNDGRQNNEKSITDILMMVPALFDTINSQISFKDKTTALVKK